MSDESNLSPRQILTGATTAEVLALLPQMGRVMVIGQSRGVTHERIGTVETVSATPEGMRIAGVCHDALIRPEGVAAIVLDTSSQMRGKVYPRLDFVDAAGDPLFSVVGMEGLEPFALLDGIARETATPRPASLMPEGERPELDPADPVHQPFAQVQEQGDEALITFDNGTLRQSWRGRIESVKPAMGFLNVMTADFHLHLKGGAFSGWDAAPGRRAALDDQAQPNGLVVAAACLA